MTSDAPGTRPDPVYARAQEEMARAMEAFVQDALESPPTVRRFYPIADTVLGKMHAMVEDRADGRWITYTLEQPVPADYIRAVTPWKEAAGEDGEA